MVSPIITNITNFISSPIGLLLIGSIVVIYFLFLKFSKPKELKAPDLNIPKLTKKQLDIYLKLHGWKRFNWNNIRIGINPIGKIISYLSEEHKVKITDQDGKVIGTTNIPIYIIKTRKPDFLSTILSIFGLGLERYVVSANVIDNLHDHKLKDQKDIILNIGTTFRSYNEIFYCEDFGRTIIHDIAVNLAFEQQTKKLVEFTPLMTLLEIEQAKVKFKSELYTKLEKERFRSDVEEYSKTKN